MSFGPFKGLVSPFLLLGIPSGRGGLRHLVLKCRLQNDRQDSPYCLDPSRWTHGGRDVERSQYPCLAISGPELF